MIAYVLAADGFEEIELIAPTDILRRGGVDTRIVGVTGMTVTGSHGIALRADCGCEDVRLSDGDCVILPGGKAGVERLYASAWVRELLEEAVRRKLLVGAICAAPSVLQRRGFLADRKFTCYPGFADAALPGGYVGGPVVCDGPFITAEGAGVSLEFGRALLTALKSAGEADRVLTGMMSR